MNKFFEKGYQMTIAELRKQYNDDLRAVKDRKEQLEAEIESVGINIERLTGAIFALNQVEQEQQKAAAATPAVPITESES